MIVVDTRQGVSDEYSTATKWTIDDDGMLHLFRDGEGAQGVASYASHNWSAVRRTDVAAAGPFKDERRP